MVPGKAVEDGLEHIVDIRFGAYESFFDHAWAKNFLDAADGSRLAGAGLCLTRDWKGTALVGRMPWLLIHSLKSFHSGFTQGNPSFSERLSRAFIEYLVNDSGLSNMRKKQLVGKAEELSNSVREEVRRTGPIFDPEAVWRDYLEIAEFQLSLWNTQRMCYGAIYYAYENFLQQCVATGKSQPAYRAKGFDKLETDFAVYFGNALRDECLKHSDIEVARYARNDLTHNGGRASERLLATSHRLTIHGGVIHIMPDDVRALFKLLSSRASNITEAAKALPAFART